MGYMFNIDKIVRDSGLSEWIIKRTKEEVRKEFPNDEMMYELHVMRAIEAEKNKALGLKTRMRRKRGGQTLQSKGYKLAKN
jgi:hypothetical protein